MDLVNIQTFPSHPRAENTLPGHLQGSVSPLVVRHISSVTSSARQEPPYPSLVRYKYSLNMVYSLSYRRPAHVDSSAASIGSERSGKVESISSGSSCPYGIPDALSFDKIISGGTCPVSRDCPKFFSPYTNILTASHHPRVHGLPCLH